MTFLQAEEQVTRSLKKYLQGGDSNAPIPPANFPLPPPPPRPRRRFVASMEKPVLRLVRCPTFVRLVRRLLDIGLKHGSLHSWWSETILELLLHLVIIALYEDSIAFA